MNLNDLISIMEDLAERQEGMNGFVFEDLSRINAGAGNDYPLIFVQPPDTPSMLLNNEVETMNIEMWVLDQYQETEQESTSLALKWSNTHNLGIHYLRQLKVEQTANGVGIVEPVAVLRGQLMHNDVLIGTKYTFQIKLTTDCDEGTFEPLT